MLPNSEFSKFNRVPDKSNLTVVHREMSEALRRKEYRSDLILQAVKIKLDEITKKFNLSDPQIVDNPYQSFDLESNLFFISFQNTEVGERQSFIIQKIMTDEHNQEFSYILDINGETINILTFEKPEDNTENHLKGNSESTKIVKSRPMFLYPQLFRLPENEVWPVDRDAQVMVIGDPYELCDRENYTILEYEFGDEILPPDISFDILENQDITEEDFKESIQSFLENLWREDIYNLERQLAGSSSAGSPYAGLMQSIIDRVAEQYTAIFRDLRNNNLDLLDQDPELFSSEIRRTLQEVKLEIYQATEGKMGASQIKKFILKHSPHISDEGLKQSIDHYLELQQDIVDSRGNPESWSLYTSEFTDLFTLAESRMEARDKTESIDENILTEINTIHAQLKSYLKDLVEAQTATRIDLIFKRVQNKVYRLRQLYIEANLIKFNELGLEDDSDYNFPQFSAALVDEEDEELEIEEAIPYNVSYSDRPQFFPVGDDGKEVDYAPERKTLLTITDEILNARDTSLMNSGIFAFSFPGTVMNNYATRSLNSAVRALENSFIYRKAILPLISQSIQDIRSRSSSPIRDESIRNFATSLERELAHQFLHKKNTQEAVSLRGFFPYKMPEIEPQDRIIALTSVSMHGWNHLEEDSFYDDLSLALNYVKVGGKYILGPINQYLYFSGYSGGFDSEGLTSALKRMKEQGLIEYEFIKKDMSDIDDHSATSTHNDDQTLTSYECAHSLVITRLK